MTVRQTEPGEPDGAPLDAPLDPALEDLLAGLDDSLSAGRPAAGIEQAVAARFGPQATELVATLKALHAESSRSPATRHASAETWTLSTPVTAVSTPAGETLWRFGRFELLQRIGSGGAGVVFKARDGELGRLVALKVARAETLFSDEARQRFRREARVLAAVRHPNIIAIHEAGETDGLPYIVQELCHGPNLAVWIRDQQQACRPVPISVAARWVMLAAQAVAHAQQLGVVHRDLKPANILLEPMPAANASSADSRVDAFIPRITDFGIAKLFDSDEDVTATIAVLGTAAYMAPEQAEGKTREVGEPADVYSLGVILYELLTGRRPIEGQTDIDTLRRLSTDAPRSIAEFRKDVPRDLQAICLKCLEKDPADRYPTAHELSSDIERFLSGVPVTARPVGFVRRAFKAYRRQRRLVRIALLASPVLAAAALLLIQRIARIPPQHEEAAPVARSYADHVRQAYELVEGTAGDTVDRQSVTEAARQILASDVPHPGDVDSRGFEWHYLWEILHPRPPKLELLREIPAHAASAYCVAFSPDGHFLATCSQDRTARVWDLATGACRATLTGHVHEINWISYVDEGRTLATSSEDGTVRLWDAKTGEQRDILWKLPVEVIGLAYDATRSHLAAGAHDGALKVWDSRTRQSLFELRIHGGKRVESLTYSPDGKLLATAGNGGVSLWDASHGYEHLVDFPTKDAESLAFSHDGRLLAVGGRRISVLSVPQGELRALLPVPGSHVRSMLFTPDDLAVIACGDELSTAWIDLRSGVSTNPFGTPATNWCVSVSGDGRQMATSDSTGIVRVWKGISSRPPCLTLDERQDVAFFMAISPDGKRIAVAATGWLHEWFGKLIDGPVGRRIQIKFNSADSQFGDVTIWDISARVPSRVLQLAAKDNKRSNPALCFSSDGQRFAYCERAIPGNVAEIRIVDSNTGAARRCPVHSKKSLLCLGHFGGRHLLVSADAALEFSDVDTGKTIKSVPLPIAGVSMSSSSHGELLAVGRPLSTIYRLSDLKEVHAPALSQGGAPVFTSDGSRVIFFEGSRFYTVSSETGQLLHTGNPVVLQGLILGDIALSPDDRTAAVASREGVLLVDVEAERQMCTLPFPRPMVRVEQLIYASDGRTIAAAAVDEIGRFGIYLWQTARAEAPTDVAGE